MSTEEALKKFTETCDKDGATLGDCVDAYDALEKTVHNPLQQGFQDSFRKAKTLEDKMCLLHSAFFIVRRRITPCDCMPKSKKRRPRTHAS